MAAGSTPERLAEVVRAHGVRDERLLAAIAEIPRAAFVPAEMEGGAYRDTPIPIPHDQVTTQPSLIAQMDALNIRVVHVYGLRIRRLRGLR